MSELKDWSLFLAVYEKIISMRQNSREIPEFTLIHVQVLDRNLVIAKERNAQFAGIMIERIFLGSSQFLVRRLVILVLIRTWDTHLGIWPAPVP